MDPIRICPICGERVFNSTGFMAHDYIIAQKETHILHPECMKLLLNKVKDAYQGA